MPSVAVGAGPIWTSRPRYRKDGTRALTNIWHEYLMQTYSDAAWVWRQQCDEECHQYEGDERAYKLENPHPTLKDFMIRLGRDWRYYREESYA